MLLCRVGCHLISAAKGLRISTFSSEIVKQIRILIEQMCLILVDLRYYFSKVWFG